MGDWSEQFTVCTLIKKTNEFNLFVLRCIINAKYFHETHKFDVTDFGKQILNEKKNVNAQKIVKNFNIQVLQKYLNIKNIAKFEKTSDFLIKFNHNCKNY